MNRVWDLGKYSVHEALMDDQGNVLSYAELESYAMRIAKIIDDRCLVFCLCRNEIGSIIGYIGMVNNAIVPVLLNDGLENELLNNLLDIYKPKYIWAPKNDLSRLKNMKIIFELFDYILLETGFDKQYQLYEELGLLLTTSGSTGSPKLVRQSYINILDNAQAITEYLELNQDERPITTLPMNYTYGLSIINTHLLVGATILVTEKSIMQKEFWDFFRQYKATSFGGVPYTYEMLDKLRFYRMKLPSLRTMTQAGGKIIPDLHEKIAKYAENNGLKFFVMYGQCEATARMGYLPAEKAVEKKGAMGIAIPGGKFWLVDDEGSIISDPYTTGELFYQGKNVTLGYAESGNDLCKGDERGGILETGDMAQFDDSGFYYIVGRKKRFLKLYGNRVNLDEIERMIKSAFDIEVASTGVDDHMHIFITEKNFADVIRDFLVSKTKINVVAFNVHVIREIPKNNAGKTLYNNLTNYYIDEK